MVGKGEEPAIELTLFADTDQVNNRLQIVVDHAGWNPAEEGKRAIMRIKHHLLAFPWVARYEALTAVGQAEMRDFDSLDDTSDLHSFMAPVKLACLSG